MSSESTPIFLSAFGSAPATSPRPPVFEYGTASAEMIATRISKRLILRDYFINGSLRRHFVDRKTFRPYAFVNRMERSDEIIEVLREIRDINREHLDDYKAAAERSIELQQRAVRRAESIGKVYRIALIVTAVLIGGVIVLIFYLMSFLRR
jgi:hypothetical protein